MSKIDLDKYYTDNGTVQHCLSVVDNLLIDYSEVIEPSAGNGAFSLQIPNCIAYDIEPEHENIIKQDFLKLDLPYKEGRLIIGNPPFGYTNNLARSFYKHSCKIADYIAFILPVGLLNNSDSLYEFDLIHSEDLGKIKYSGRYVHCCFNVYKRPNNKILNKKPNYKIDWIVICRDDEKKYDDFEYDFAICRRGNIGKIRTENLQSSTHKIKVLDKTKINLVKETILNFDWIANKPFCSAPYITKNDIWKLF